MTKTQKIVYDEIIRFIFENNYSPTVRELTRLVAILRPQLLLEF